MLANQKIFTIYGDDTRRSSLATMGALKNIVKLSYSQITPVVLLPSKPIEGLWPRSTEIGKAGHKERLIPVPGKGPVSHDTSTEQQDIKSGRQDYTIF